LRALRMYFNKPFRFSTLFFFDHDAESPAHVRGGICNVNAKVHFQHIFFHVVQPHARVR
jgi:hypothetical protein